MFYPFPVKCGVERHHQSWPVLVCSTATNIHEKRMGERGYGRHKRSTRRKGSTCDGGCWESVPGTRLQRRMFVVLGLVSNTSRRSFVVNMQLKKPCAIPFNVFFLPLTGRSLYPCKLCYKERISNHNWKEVNGVVVKSQWAILQRGKAWQVFLRFKSRTHFVSCMNQAKIRCWV